ncbi:HipA N-terminal domain-containing protein, partial [Solirhodobacter olei]|uniref:HipA N-terminal domain-containing protein n=1 Tax=Solirhodobacter olei TaxID=2493082 RepID=UPI0013E368AD
MGRAPQTRTLDVWVNGRLTGYYRYSPSGGVSFQYERAWLDWGHAFPLSRQLPLIARSQNGRHVNAVFENLLPDNAPIRRMIAERTEARSDRPHDLLAAIGRDCVGAMQFVPHGQDPGDPFVIEGVVQSEAQIAETLRHLTRDPLGIVQGGEPLRISLAGAQEKTAYLRQGEDWVKPHGLTPTTHIFKRPIGVTQRGLDL